MCGAIPPLPQYAFMVRCSVKEKAQGQLYLSSLPYVLSIMNKVSNSNQCLLGCDDVMTQKTST
jgi:hypothetical protein